MSGRTVVAVAHYCRNKDCNSAPAEIAWGTCGSPGCIAVAQLIRKKPLQPASIERKVKRLVSGVKAGMGEGCC